MKTFCPFCPKEITPETTQCPSCDTIYDFDTLKFLRILIKEASKEYPNERRKQARITRTFKVAYSTPKSFVDNYIQKVPNVSLSGLFVKTDDPLNPGEKFNLKIFLPDKGDELEVLGEVIWSHKEKRVTPEKIFPPGMGVKFLNLSKEGKERIISLLKRAL